MMMYEQTGLMVCAERDPDRAIILAVNLFTRKSFIADGWIYWHLGNKISELLIIQSKGYIL